MKRIFAILFLFLFFTVNTAFGQLLRIPTLVHHFLEHVQLDNSTLEEFITEHYAKEINHPDDKHNDHQNLPFKALDNHAMQVVISVSQPSFIITPVFTAPVALNTPIRNQQHYTNAFLNNIWQPPRFS